MVRIACLIAFLVFLSSCSMLNKHRSMDTAFSGLNIKEAQRIQKENYKNYTNSYNYKMQKEVERRHKEELRRSKYAHKNKIQ